MKGSRPPAGSWESWCIVATSVFDPMRVGVLAADSTGTIVYRNPALGEPLERGDSLERLTPSLAGAAMQTAEDGLCRSHRVVLEPSATEGRAELSPILLEGQRAGVLCVFLGTGPGMEGPPGSPEAERLVRERDAVIDSSTAGLWVTDGRGNVLRVNPTSAQLSAVDPGEVMGRNMEELVAEGYMDGSSILEAIQKKRVVNKLVNTRAGIKVMATAVPVFDDKGDLFRVVVTERDITELERLHQQLEEQIAMRDRYRLHVMEMREIESVSEKIVARSPNMLNVLRKAVKVGKVDSTVLILGESGVGKGAIADLIHKSSTRSRSPMVRISCGAIPESLVESELFGYERGAFTGAQDKGKPGYLEMADEGILFLDEIGELPLPSQVKLLGVLEDGRFERLGGTASRRVDVRIVAATNRDLEQMVKEGRFRKDLYYRLNVIPLHVPPLRKRRECIAALLSHFLERFASKVGTRKQLAPAALDALLSYSYPGNVRELINLCERLVVLTERDYVLFDDLPSEVRREVDEKPPYRGFSDEDATLKEVVEWAERSALIRARKKYGNQMRMAAALDVTQPTIARKMRKYGLR